MFDNKKLVSWAVVSFASDRELSKQVRAAELMASIYFIFLSRGVNIFLNRVLIIECFHVFGIRVALKSRGGRKAEGERELTRRRSFLVPSRARTLARASDTDQPQTSLVYVLVKVIPLLV